MKTSLKCNDKVRITDGSQAILLEGGSRFHSANIGLSKNVFVVEEVSLFNYATESCPEGLHNIIIRDTETGKRYVHSSNFVEKIEENYKPISIGDRVIINGREYMFVSADTNLVVLVDLKSGCRWGRTVEVNWCYQISLDEFKKLTSSISWEMIYGTLKRGPNSKPL
jgi:hypothetical protein